MRGSPDLQMTMLTTVSTEAMVPADHPLRRSSPPEWCKCSELSSPMR
jgi:hypothetical protein